MALCDHDKNEKNPDCDADFSFTSSGKATNTIKEGLSGFFNIQSNKELIAKLKDADIKYPVVKQVLIDLFSFE